jgi:type IV fimbrial biogenesis protein FimT
MLNKALHRCRGMTLIELAVTVTILALLLIGAGPSIGAWIRNTKVRNTASSILAGLNQARSESVRRSRPVRFQLVSLTNPTVMDASCALSGSGVSWVVSVSDPTSYCQYAPSLVATNANDPMIVESKAGGVDGQTMSVSARIADGSAAASVVTFNAFGRVADAVPIDHITVSNVTAGGDYRTLRIEIGAGGKVRLCDMGVTDTTDSRYCPTRAIP